jgi:outer membrane protein
MLALPCAAFAQGTTKFGTIDMNRAFKEYSKTKEAEAKINEAKNAAKKEYDDRADAYKKALDEINNLNKQLDAPALSADAKTAKAKERDDKIGNIKNMEREINEFRQTRERQLQEQALRMREGIVKEITEVVMDKVKANQLDFVFDKSGMSLNGVPLLMYARDNVDFTNDVVAVLNKPGRTSSVSTTAEKPATSTAAGAASASPSASASPAKATRP